MMIRIYYTTSPVLGYTPKHNARFIDLTPRVLCSADASLPAGHRARMHLGLVAAAAAPALPTEEKSDGHYARADNKLADLGMANRG